VFAWVNGKDPRPYGLDVGLWTRSMIASLIAQKFTVKLGLTTLGKLLAKLGLTPQKPLERAYQHNPEAIEIRAGTEPGRTGLEPCKTDRGFQNTTT
jgi:transposase